MAGSYPYGDPNLYHYVDPGLMQGVQPARPFHSPPLPRAMDFVNRNLPQTQPPQFYPSSYSNGVYPNTYTNQQGARGGVYPDIYTNYQGAVWESCKGLSSNLGSFSSVEDDGFESGRVVPYTSESGAIAGTSQDGSVSEIETTHPSLDSDKLVQIPGCMVHLIDPEASPLLANGALSVFRVAQPGGRTATVIQVGDSLRWPLGSDETVDKVGSLRYIFSLHVSANWSAKEKPKLDAEGEAVFPSNPFPSNTVPTEGTSSNAEQVTEVLYYGVTLGSDTSDEDIGYLNDCLRSVCVFREPEVQVSSDAGFLQEVIQEHPKSKGPTQELALSDARAPDLQLTPSAREERDSEFWTRIAPCVDNYQSTSARAIAMGSGIVIRSILFLADSAKSGIQHTGTYFRGKMDKADKDAKISPRLKERMKSVRKVTKMTDNAASSILKAVVSFTGKATSGLFHSRSLQRFGKSMPGEITASSLEAFDKTMEALEIAGKTVLKTTSRETRATVAHKYGQEAAKVTKDGLCASGNLVHSAWSGVKLGKALYPSALIKGAIVQNLKTSSQSSSRS